MILRTFFIATLALSSLAPTLSPAEPVEIQLPDGGRGQGWLFRDPGTDLCGVVTAAHVVSGVDRREIVIVGREGAEAYVSSVRILSPPLERDVDGVVVSSGIDAALLLVDGPLKAQGCSGSITGPTNLSLTLGRTATGELLRFDAGEFPKQPVGFTGAGSVRPEILVLTTRPGDPAVAPGFSGAAVVDPPEMRTAPGAEPTPLAMVIQIAVAAPKGQVVAVRYDAIWRLVRAALVENRASPSPSPTSVSASGAPMFSVSDWSGATLDPKCPAPNMLESAACPWRTRPLPGSHELQFTLRSLKGPTPIEDVMVDVEGYLPTPGRTVSLDVNPTDRPEDWAFIRRCDGSPGLVHCRFSQAIALSFRLTFDAMDERALNVRVRSITP